jgi:hypothetical protein
VMSNLRASKYSFASRSIKFIDAYHTEKACKRYGPSKSIIVTGDCVLPESRDHNEGI